MRKPDHGIEPGIGVGGEAREEPTNEANAARWEASEEWMEAFESLATPSMLRRCAGFAAMVFVKVEKVCRSVIASRTVRTFLPTATTAGRGAPPGGETCMRPA
jgi:hypothetical protein